MLDKLKGPRRMLFMKQANMKRMVFVLTPIGLSAIYFYGWRVAAVVAVSVLAGLVTEYITTYRRKAPISMAVFVTTLLYGLSLPVTTPFMVAVVGAVVAILFGKEVFGGFGRNFANPAIVGRAFVYVCFPNELTNRFVPAFQGFPAGFARWSWERLDQLPGYLAAKLPEGADTGSEAVADAVSQASPMFISKTYGSETLSEGASWWDMFWGNLGGVFQYESAGQTQTQILTGGSAGEGCAALIALAAIYLLVTKTANWRLMLGGAIGLVGATLLWRHLLGFNEEMTGVPPVHFTLVAGTTAYALVFMFTDPVSAPNKKSAQWAYAILIGFLVVTLRWRGVFVAAASFSILLGNLVGPSLDMLAEWRIERKKARQESRKKSADGEEPAKEATA